MRRTGLADQHDEWQVCRRCLAHAHAHPSPDIVYEEAALPVGTAWGIVEDDALFHHLTGHGPSHKRKLKEKAGGKKEAKPDASIILRDDLLLYQHTL
jgi:hypothetical protein